MEYVLCIEGIGWLSDEIAGPKNGFEGNLFTTADLNGDLASKLALTAKANILTKNQATTGDALGDTTGFTAVDSATLQSLYFDSESNAPDFPGRVVWVDPSSTVNGTRGGVQTDAVSASATTAYVGSVYVRKSGAGSTSVRVYLRDEVNGIDGTATTATVTGTAWSRVEATLTTGAGSPTISMYVLEETADGGVAFNIRQAQIETGSTATVWFSGTVRTGSVTVHKGLMLPESVGDKIDPLTYKYEVGGMDFEIVDDIQSSGASYIAASVTPHRTGNETTVSSSFAYTADDLVLVDGTDFAAGGTVWLGGRELVYLGSKSGGGPHTYTDCIRGYLGTPRGTVAPAFPDVSGMAWAAGTVAHSVNKFMYNRRVRLYAHAPGETPDGMLLLYSGRLRGLRSDGGGTSWTFESAGEQVNAFGRVKYCNSAWNIRQTNFIAPNGTPFQSYSMPGSGSGTPTQETSITEQEAGSGLARLSMNLNSAGITAFPGGDDSMGLISIYQYRSEPGGTAGAKAAILTTAPQAPTVGNTAYCADSYIQAGERIVHVLAKRPHNGSTEYEGDKLMCSALNVFGDFWLNWSLEAMPVKFLLDNVGDEWKLSRFAVNRMVRRNPIDVLLMFLTSTHDEFYIADSDGSGTGRQIGFASLPTTDWAGFALHCVEGADKGYARKILSTSSTNIVLEQAFPSGTDVGGAEYQVRNTIYDVLPIGWGLAVPNHRIDVAQFEYVRDRFLADVTIGKFVIGTSERTDILDMLLKDICQAYNILIFIGRDGRLTCRYMGEALGDGLVDDYVTISKSDVIGDVGDLQYHLDKPIGSVDLRVRSTGRAVVAIQYDNPYGGSVMYEETGRTYATIQAPSMDGATTTLKVTSTELASAFGGENLESIEVSAMFNSVEDCGQVIALAYSRLSRYASAPPTMEFMLGLHQAEDIQAGTYLSITHDSIIDPYSGSTGLSSRVGKVLQTDILLRQEDPGISVVVELLPNVAAGKIAPACEVVSKSSDANGQYLKCYPDKYVIDTDNDRDHNYFAVDDRVELRDKTGALKEDLGTVTGFGSDFVSDPSQATDSDANIRIYVSDASITSSIASGDYITFKPWSGSNTDRMDGYAPYASSAGALTGGDGPKEFG